MMHINLNEREITSALAAVTDALDRAADRIMKKNAPQYALDHHDNLKNILKKLSTAYTESDI